MPFFLYDTVTGERGLEVPTLASSSSCETIVDAAGTVTAQIPCTVMNVSGMELRAITEPGRVSLAYQAGSMLMEAGPIWGRRYDRDNGVLKVVARGLESIFDHRYVLPAIAATLPTSQWFVPDPDNDTRTIPAPAVRSAWGGLDLGTIVKRAVQRAQSWAAGGLPIDFEPDRVGVDARVYEGPDFATLADVIRDVRSVDGGPEVRLTPYLDGNHVRHRLETGSADSPLLAASDELSWDLSAPSSVTRNVVVDEDAGLLASYAWATGGRSLGSPLIARQSSPRLTDNGYPLLESYDSSHGDAPDIANLNAHASANLAEGQATSEVWSFDARVDASPRFGTYRAGAYATLSIEGDPFIPKGRYRMRTLGLRTTEDASFVNVSCGPGRSVDG